MSQTITPTIFTIILGLSLFNCNRNIYIDRTQFIKDGDTIPTIQLDYYKSVQQRPNQDESLAVAMAISGGGSRASNFGIGIMMGLEKIQLENGQNALNQVDYLSTVSGGGFAGGAYVSALFDHEFFHKNEPFLLSKYVDAHIKNDLSKSFVNSLLGGYVKLKTWVSAVDYGDALEKDINKIVLGFDRRKKFDQPRELLLGDVFVPKSEPQIPVKLPMHITNSSTMGNLAIFPFTPDILELYGVNGYTHNMKIIEKPGLSPFEIPLSVGIKASGSFPVLVPNTTLNSDYDTVRQYLHIMDGAMTDNQGSYTAVEVLKQDHSSQKVLLVVDADASGNLFTFSRRKEANPPLKVFFSLSSSGLYARRATLKKDLSEMGEKFDFEPIFLSFYTIIEDIETPDNLPEEIKPRTEQIRLIELLRQPYVTLSDVDRHILYELLVNIGTKYTIKPNEQELLFLAGQLIVSLRAEEIKRVMEERF